MRDLPSRGRCHAIFLLAYSARVRSCASVEEWIRASSDKPTVMASSLDLLGTASLLLTAGLATLDGQIQVAPRLARLDRVADLVTLKEIARLLISRRPPDWLPAVVVDGVLASEYIPAADLVALHWLGDDLEQILVGTHDELYGTRDDQVLKLLGDAGELAIMAALHARGLKPRHVALVSDRFGYDIELDGGQYLQGLEVKAAVSSTSGRLLLTRNEYEVAVRMADRWSLVQVTFSAKALLSGRARAADVERIRGLAAADIVALAPEEGPAFRWVESAEFKPSMELWRAIDLRVPDSFEARLADDLQGG